jgi:hypothetical protein
VHYEPEQLPPADTGRVSVLRRWEWRIAAAVVLAVGVRLGYHECGASGGAV